jgi:holo-[acyl-carrier protein] synthase
MLTSLGIDITETSRIRQALERWPEMRARLFTQREREYCEQKADPAAHYAARFAAKEATAKAVGRWLRWQEVEVVSGERNRPTLELSGESAEIAGVTEGARLLLSLSHSREYAVAVVARVAPDDRRTSEGNLAHGGSA